MRNPSLHPSRRLKAAFLIASLCPFVASFVIAPDSADRSVHASTLTVQEGTIWDGVYTDE